MNNNTLVGGTTYKITGGQSLINSTSYGIAKGKSLIGGTAYDISFAPAPLIVYDGGWSSQVGYIYSGYVYNLTFMNYKSLEISNIRSGLMYARDNYIYVDGTSVNTSSGTVYNSEAISIGPIDLTDYSTADFYVYSLDTLISYNENGIIIGYEPLCGEALEGSYWSTVSTTNYTISNPLILSLDISSAVGEKYLRVCALGREGAGCTKIVLR